MSTPAGEVWCATENVVDVLFELETVKVPFETVVGSATPIDVTSESGAKNSKKPVLIVLTLVLKCGAATVKLTAPVDELNDGSVIDCAFVKNQVPRIASFTV